MNYSISNLSVVPVRNSSSEKSEQVTQLLFGEIVENLGMKGKAWTKVRCIWDNTIGWVDSRQIKPITQSEYELFSKNYAYTLELIHPLMAADHHIPVTIGAKLPNFDGMKCTFEEKFYTYSGQAVFPTDVEPIAELVLKLARRYLFAPQQWGGRSPLGIDAGGLIQMVFQLVGINMHREPNQQVHQGEPVDFVEQALEGDLAFFENRKGNINHCGIIMSNGRVIHAAECVRIDRIDHYGIYNDDLKKYTHKLRVIRRVLPKVSPENKKKEAVSAKIPKQVELF